MRQPPLNPIEAMLSQLRQAFLEELSNRCDEIENLILKMEGSQAEQETFNELFRRVHSLKGSGGTHGLDMVTSICHHMENRLTESEGRLDKVRANTLLAYVDLLRRVASDGGKNGADISSIGEDLARLQAVSSKGRLAVLLAESSRAVQIMCQQAFDILPIQLTCVNDGISALQHLVQQRFDYAVLAGELKGLNGIAVAAALRASGGRNAGIPIILVSSNRQAIPTYLHVQEVLPRDQALIPRLAKLIAA